MYCKLIVTAALALCVFCGCNVSKLSELPSDVKQFATSSQLDEKRNSTYVFGSRGKDLVEILFSEFSFSTPNRQRIHKEEIYRKVWNPEQIFDDHDVRALCTHLLREDYKSADELIAKRPEIVNAESCEGMRILQWSIFLGIDGFEYILKRKAETDFYVESFYDIYYVNNRNFIKSHPIYDKNRQARLSFLSFLSILEGNEQTIHPGTKYFSTLLFLALKYGADPNFDDHVFTVYAIPTEKDFYQRSFVNISTGSICRIASGRYSEYRKDLEGKKRVSVVVSIDNTCFLSNKARYVHE